MKDFDIDDILGQDDIVPVTDFEFEQIENVGGDIAKVKPVAEIFEEAPVLLGDDYPLAFHKVADRIVAQCNRLPKVNHEAIYAELKELTIESVATPTLQHINIELQKLQAVKERLSEIMSQIIPSHVYKKRSIDILQDSWIRFSQEKSADKRKADSVYRISQFEADFLATDSLLKTAMHIAKNLDSIQEILSRRITIIGLQLKLNDSNRHSVPDYDFQGDSLSGLNEFGEAEIGRPTDDESQEEGFPEMLSF